MDKVKVNLDNLRKIREKKNITQIKLAVDLEVSQELISQYERGLSFPNVSSLATLSKYFNCSTDYLLGLTNNPNAVVDLNKKDAEFQNIYDKYKSLTDIKKKELNCFLDFLVNYK